MWHSEHWIRKSAIPDWNRLHSVINLFLSHTLTASCGNLSLSLRVQLQNLIILHIWGGKCDTVGLTTAVWGMGRNPTEKKKTSLGRCQQQLSGYNYRSVLLWANSSMLSTNADFHYNSQVGFSKFAKSCNSNLEELQWPRVLQSNMAGCRHS